MTRKINKEKYGRILDRLDKGESQQSIVIAEKCSYGTISAAKHWNKTWRTSTLSTTKSGLSQNKTNIVLSIPNFWLERLNEDILTGVWADYSDAVLDIIRTYFRTRYEDVQPENRKPLNTRIKVLKEFKEVFKQPKKNLQSPIDEGDSLPRQEELLKESQRIASKFQKSQSSEKLVFRDYHGFPLLEEEFDVLMELDKQIGEIPRWEVDLTTMSNTRMIFPSTEKKGLSKFSYVIWSNHIIALIIQNKGLISLPKTIHRLKYLQHLNLRKNELTELPETISELEYLDELILDSNALTSIPDSFGNLTNLETLQLHNNKLTGIPEVLGALRCDLGLANNNIVSVSKSILHPRRLSTRIIDLTGNPVWSKKLTEK